MIQTKLLVTGIGDVPREWVFEYYLKLNEKLTGQDVRIKSMFNPDDDTPSMWVYWKKDIGQYRFKDFSTDGNSGDGLFLVQCLNGISRGEATIKIISDYSKYLLQNGEGDKRDFVLQTRYKVKEYVLRGWTNLDQKYWTQFNIGSKLLSLYNVKPLDNFLLEKEIGEDVRRLVIKGSYVYGYFRNDGQLYKIYQPFARDSKFIKVQDYIQGTDQLKMKADYLVINSSLKDILSFTSLGITNVETVAPDSENSLISADVINSWKLKYKSIITLFDNDQAGETGVTKYNSVYDLKGCQCPMSKDVADLVRDMKVNEARNLIFSKLKQLLT